MSFAQIFVIVALAIPIFLAVWDKLRIDIAALAIALILGAGQFFGLGVLGPAGQPSQAIKAIEGFSQPTVIILISLFILTRALDKSGVTRWLANRIIRVGGNSESRMIALLAGTTAFFSLFMNNLAAGALMLSPAIEISRRTGIKPSKLLIPVAYGSLLGGVATYLTTANIIVSDLLRIAQPPQSAVGFRDFFPTGGLIALAGILYLALAGPRLLPDREPGYGAVIRNITGSELEDHYQLGERLWEVQVLSGSPLSGKTLAESGIGGQFGLTVTAIWRGEQAIFAPSVNQVIQEDDVLVVVGRKERVEQMCLHGMARGRFAANQYLTPQGVMVYEVVLAPHSSAEGKTLKELDFRRRYGFTAAALKRADRSFRTDVGDIPLAFGDTLLVLGSPTELRRLRRSPDFFVLEPNPVDLPVDGPKAALTVAVIAAAIAASVAGAPTYLAMLAGALIAVLAGVLSMEEAYQAVEWQAVFLIAGMYAVSVAMVETGLAGMLGNGMIEVTRPLGPLALAAGAYLLTALLTQVIGGQVSALVTGPVTISAAISMGVSPQAVAVATAIGCSASFLTPIAHPVNILMVAPGNYSFGDFFKIGWLLTVVSFVMLLVGLVLFWRL